MRRVYFIYRDKKKIAISNALTSDGKILECAKFERDHRDVIICVLYKSIYKCVVISAAQYIQYNIISYPLKIYQYDNLSKRRLDLFCK